jgi:ZIP family zinc transporter
MLNAKGRCLFEGERLMTFATTVGLGAIAGFTIYLGLPFARLPTPSQALQGFLNALATGILVFLFWDVITKASEPIDGALVGAQHGAVGPFAGLLVLFACGFGVGLLSLIYLERVVIRPTAEGVRAGVAAPQHLALMIAVGIGAHNFSEGLAIGQAAVSGAISLATILIIGFGLHNMTEGFGIGAPLVAGGRRPSWGFLGLVGLIGGGPTFLGTVVGFGFHSEYVFVAFLSLAAGSILYVIGELLHAGRRLGVRELAGWGVLLGFLSGYATDLVVTWGGA